MRGEVAHIVARIRSLIDADRPGITRQVDAQFGPQQLVTAPSTACVLGPAPDFDENHRTTRGDPAHNAPCPSCSGKQFNICTAGCSAGRVVGLGGLRGVTQTVARPVADRRRTGAEEVSISGAACGTVAHDAPRRRSGERRPALGPLRRVLTGTTPPHRAMRPTGPCPPLQANVSPRSRSRPDGRGVGLGGCEAR